jgi:hypothetical protein
MTYIVTKLQRKLFRPGKNLNQLILLIFVTLIPESRYEADQSTIDSEDIKQNTSY